jgi:hypothetical protein
MRKNNEILYPSTDEMDILTESPLKVGYIKILVPAALLVLLIAALIILFTSIIPLLSAAKEIGNTVGDSSGNVAGLAVGSVEGVVLGVQEGVQEGREAGLSAEDTIAKISNVIESNISGLGNLEVLIANVGLTTYHEIGDKYGALYFTRGNAVFTVDLSKVMITHKDGLISIVLPKPVAEIKLDPTQTELLKDWQNSYFDGTDSEGFESQLNQINDIKNCSESEIANYTELMNLAAESAVNQVTEIANAVRGNNNEITVTVSILAD